MYKEGLRKAFGISRDNCKAELIPLDISAKEGEKKHIALFT